MVFPSYEYAHDALNDQNGSSYSGSQDTYSNSNIPSWKKLSLKVIPRHREPTRKNLVLHIQIKAKLIEICGRKSGTGN